MKLLRITIAASDVARYDEQQFNKVLDSRLQSAGFDVEAPVIRIPRWDIDAVDIVQPRYYIWDKWDVQWTDFKWKVYRWFKINF